MTKTANAAASATTRKPRVSAAKNKGADSVPTEDTATVSPPKDTKAARILTLLQRPEGTTLAEMMDVTGWQQHSVRGFLAGTVKKKLGHALASEKGEQGRIYRIAVTGASA